MNKENLVLYFQESMDSCKNLISKNSNSLMEYWSMKKMKGFGMKLGTKCSNCMFILLNVFYLIIALLMLVAGGTGQFAYLFYGLKFEYTLISIAWIVSGAVLLFVSVFGIIGACKNSVAWTNVYGIFMMIAFVIQLAAAIVGFSCISKSESIARHTLDRLIYSSSFFEPSVATMNYIQKSLQCCGIDGPNDWGSNWKFNSYNNDYYGRTSTSSPSTRTPESCCASGSGYDNLRCENYIQKGCLSEMHEITLQIIMTIDSVALAIAVVQIVGIVSAFVVAKLIRRMKSHEVVTKDKHRSNEVIFGHNFFNPPFSAHGHNLFNPPSYIDGSMQNGGSSFTHHISVSNVDNVFANLVNEPTVDITAGNIQFDNISRLQERETLGEWIVS